MTSTEHHPQKAQPEKAMVSHDAPAWLGKGSQILKCKSNKIHHYFGSENYKMVMKKFKIHLNKWRYVTYYLTRRLNIVRM